MVESTTTLRYYLIERLERSSQGEIWIARRADLTRRVVILKRPQTWEDVKALNQEMNIFVEIGLHRPHENVIQMIEYHPEQPEYIAITFAKAKSLLLFLLSPFGKNLTQNEKWTRYFFKQVIQGLSHIHEQDVAHLDMRVDNILLDVDVSGTTLTAMIADFGCAKSKVNPDNIVQYGDIYGPPELVRNGITPFDGEKADVFASAFILLALQTGNWFGRMDQCLSPMYEHLMNGGDMAEIWQPLGSLAPSTEF